MTYGSFSFCGCPLSDIIRKLIGFSVHGSCALVQVCNDLGAVLVDCCDNAAVLVIGCDLLILYAAQNVVIELSTACCCVSPVRGLCIVQDFISCVLQVLSFFVDKVELGISIPEARYVTISSFIPFFAPLVMFLRVGMLDLPLWEPLLSIAIMLVTIGILGWFGARVYRGGVLMYGSSQSLKDIRKAIRLGNSK